MLEALAHNPQVVPPSLTLAEAQADLAALDQLRPPEVGESWGRD